MISPDNSSQNRFPIIDAFRGFALFGVLIANVPFTNEGGLDEILVFLFHLLIDTKFITIFSILFGLGFYLQWQGAQKKGQNFVRYFVIRMALLFLIGSIHGLLVWNGDILRSYALGGLGLLLVRNWSRKKRLIFAIICIVGLTGLAFISPEIFGWTYTYDHSLAGEHYETTSFLRYLQLNFITDPWSNFRMDMPITLFFTFGSMLVGFLLGEIGFFTQPEKRPYLSRKFILLGSTVGLGSSYLFQLVTTGGLELDQSLIFVPFLISGGMFMQSMMYIALFVNLFQFRVTKRLLSAFIPVGRTSLSNYLFQSVFYLLIFLPCLPPFRLFGTIPASLTWLIALFFFCFQSWISWAWLKKFRQGPIEYLWKSISYRFM